MLAKTTHRCGHDLFVGRCEEDDAVGITWAIGPNLAHAGRALTRARRISVGPSLAHGPTGAHHRGHRAGRCRPRLRLELADRDWYRAADPVARALRGDVRARLVHDGQGDSVPLETGQPAGDKIDLMGRPAAAHSQPFNPISRGETMTSTFKSVLSTALVASALAIA